MNKTALILVDLQNDFCPGGSLAVAGGDEVMSVANRLQDRFDLVIASKDWHPHKHVSFASTHPGHQMGEAVTVHNMKQELWPDHCIQDTWGSEFHPQLQTQKIHKIVYKGIDKNIDSYSAFFDNEHQRSTGLGDYLKEQGVQDIYIMGLATDYCVKYSCKDAVHLGFKVTLIEDGCRGVDLKPGDVERALQEMRAEGVKQVRSEDLLALMK